MKQVVYKSAQRKRATKLAKAFVGRNKFVPLVEPVGRNGFAPVLGVAGPGEFVFVVLVRIVSPDEFALFPDPGEVVPVVGVMGPGGVTVVVGTMGSGEAGVLVGTVGSEGVVVVIMIMGAGASGVLVGTGGCGGAGGSIMTVGSEPAGVLIIVVFVGEGGMKDGEMVESVPGSGVTLDCIIGGGVDASAGVDASGGGAESTRLRNSLGCPNQKVVNRVEKNRSRPTLTFSVHRDGIAPCLIRQ